MGHGGRATAGDHLSRYRERRDFSATPEPRGRKTRSHPNRLAYYIQRHHARRLHYDFRLELNGTLKSWAVPKGPSLDPGDKRLAVHVEDHPLDYGSFEGEIPKGQYGAGRVVLWDRGIWFPEGDPEEGLRKGHLKFRLAGHKLAGGWALVRMHGGDGKENWLLIKEHDDQAKGGAAADIVEQRPESVLDAPDVAAPGPAQLEDARKADLPALIKPQLATLTDRPPAGEDWLMEIKFDGYRALCRLDGHRTKLYTRAGNDWTAKWRTVSEAARRLPARQAWLDGEIVAVDRRGAVSFQLLQNMDTEPRTARLVYYIFDLLYLDGYDLRRVPLIRRKELLRSLLAGTDNEVLRFSDHLSGDAGTIFKQACEQGLEGLIAKRAGAAYISQRSRSWLKVKCIKRQEFVIGGYTDPGGGRTGFGALLLGVQGDHGLRYAGRVGTGFDAAALDRLSGLFQGLRADKPPFINPPAGREAAGVRWLKPQLVAEVKFAQWTQDGIIRHSAFIGLCNDKRPREVRREMPQPVQTLAPETTAPQHKRRRAASVRLSHADRMLFPDSGIRKQDLADYYETIADWILPHLSHRPLTLVRCPRGITQHCFYQKHANTGTPQALARVAVNERQGKTEYYMTADRLSALLSLVQMNVLELHTWSARRPRLDRPDRMIFDLDPAPGLAWGRVIEAAQLVKMLLEEIGLRSFVKTTGGKGLHIVAPLKADRPWDEVKGFSRAIAYHLARTLPERFTAKMTKSGRTGKVFIDYLRNGREATAVAAYSTRAKPGAPVSAPIAWEELNEDLRADTYNFGNIRARLAGLKRDPWEEYASLKQRITAGMLRRFRDD
jgi:bifunctional non-homologous end joining protein LigD